MYRVALAVAALTAVAAMAAFAAHARGADARTLVVVAHSRGTAMHLAHPKRPALGDGFAERGVLTTGAGRPSGTFGGQGTLLSLAGKGSELALFGFALPSGTITVAGEHVSAEHYSMAIVGGTGAFDGARGTVSFAPAANDAVRVTFTLLS